MSILKIATIKNLMNILESRHTQHLKFYLIYNLYYFLIMYISMQNSNHIFIPTGASNFILKADYVVNLIENVRFTFIRLFISFPSDTSSSRRNKSTRSFELSEETRTLPPNLPFTCPLYAVCYTRHTRKKSKSRERALLFCTCV